MKLRPYLSLALTLALGALRYASAQQPTIPISGAGQVPNIAVTDFRASGAAQPFMAAFNATVLADLQGSPLVKVIPKTLYPLQFPQTATDLLPGQAAAARTQVGLHLSHWNLPPINANYLGFGYGVEQTGQFIVFGYFYNTLPTMPSIQQAQ